MKRAKGQNVQKSNERLFVAYLTSGLGNRLRPLASAIAYCARTGRQLKVYWDTITPYACLTPLERLYKNQFEHISLEEIESLGKRSIGLYTERGPGHNAAREASRFGRDQLHKLSQKSPARLCSEVTLEDDADVVLVYDNNYLTCLPLEESIKALRSLVPQDEVVDRVRSSVERLGLVVGTKGVHARGTDFLLQSALELYSGLIRSEIDVNRGERFFLATDDIGLESGIAAAFPGLVMTRDDRMHLQLNEGKTTWTDPDSFTISAEHGVDALIDIYMLSCTDLVVFHPGSTFGEISRHLHHVFYEQKLLSPASSLGVREVKVTAGDLEKEFRVRATKLLPRGAGEFADALAEGSAGPSYLESLPASFAYWESIGYTIPIMERMYFSGISQPHLDWDGDVFSTLAAIGYDRFPFELFKSLCPYPEAIPQLRTMRSYIAGRRVLIVGSQSFWGELFCAISGASAITTVEYREIRWTSVPQSSSQLRTITWDQFTEGIDEHLGSYDLVLTYGSLEHSGLGRYGERVMPLGDLYTFFLMSRCLRANGMCAVAVPTGPDLTHFNAHRIYGEKRIRAMEQIADFRYLGIVAPGADYLANETVDFLKDGWTLISLAKLPLGSYRQPILCFGARDFDFAKYGTG